MTGICAKPEFKIIGWIYIYNTSIFLSLGPSCAFSLALKGRGFLRCLLFAILFLFPCCLWGTDIAPPEAPGASWRVLCPLIFLPPSRPMPSLAQVLSFDRAPGCHWSQRKPAYMHNHRGDRTAPLCYRCLMMTSPQVLMTAFTTSRCWCLSRADNHGIQAETISWSISPCIKRAVLVVSSIPSGNTVLDPRLLSFLLPPGNQSKSSPFLVKAFSPVHLRDLTEMWCDISLINDGHYFYYSCIELFINDVVSQLQAYLFCLDFVLKN